MSGSEVELRLVVTSERGLKRIVVTGEPEAVSDYAEALPPGSEWRLQMRTRVIPEWGEWVTKDGGVA